MEVVSRISERAKQRILIAILISHTDRDGERLIDPFLKLPPRDEYPDYYKIITTPMDVEIISSKIETGLYSDLDALERDFIQMCYNAQLYNAQDSVISKDSIVLQNLFLEEKPRVQHEKHRKKVMQKVFGQELLRERILDYVLHSEKEKKTICNIIRSCRLVSKDWLRSTSRVLLKCHEPVFRFEFRSYYAMRTDEILDGFVSAVEGPPSRPYDGDVPPFSITANAGFLFQEELRRRRQSFLDLLLHCGNGLVEFNLYYYCNVDLFKLMNNSWLPNLRKFEVFISRLADSSSGPNHIVFVQSILDACKQLKYFRMDDHMDHDYLPQTLVFPSSVTELTLIDWLPDVEALARNLPPTLQVLKLKHVKIPLQNGLVTSILEKVQKTLKRFYLSLNKRLKVQPLQPMTFRLPLMEKLEILEMGDETLELEQTFPSLHQFVPVLTSMRLFRQTPSAIQKWTDRSCFHSVRCLKAHLSSLELDDHGYNIEVNFDNRTLESMKRAFPNLQELDIRMIDPETALFLKFAMKEMRQLKVLRVFALDYNRQWNDAHPQFWDALLLGISIESVAALKKCPELWEDLQKESTVSIRNLTDLHTFHLTSLFDDYKFFDVSSEVFQYAFSEMPNLTNMLVDHGFRVSRETKQAWRKQGRTLKTYFDFDTDQAGDEESDEDETC